MAINRCIQSSGTLNVALCLLPFAFLLLPFAFFPLPFALLLLPYFTTR
jgi:hypothetical protein